MDSRIHTRLTSVLLALLLCLMLPSCSLVSAVKGVLVDLADKPSDFDRYIEYLYDLNEDHQDVYDGYGYLAMAYPCQVQDDVCLSLAGILNAKGGNTDKFYSLTVVMVIPEGGQDFHYLFSFSEDNEDGSRSVIVEGSGVLNACAYQGTLPAFDEYTNNADGSEEHYLEMATDEFNRLLSAAQILLARADLTLDALGFTYTPAEIETDQTVCSPSYSDSILCLP